MDAVDEAEGVEVGDYEEQIENFGRTLRQGRINASSACAKASASGRVEGSCR